MDLESKDVSYAFHGWPKAEMVVQDGMVRVTLRCPPDPCPFVVYLKLDSIYQLLEDARRLNSNQKNKGT